MKKKAELTHEDRIASHSLGVLKKAHDVVVSGREGRRELPEIQFPKIAKAWSAILSGKLREDITPSEVGLLMMTFKIVRESGKHDQDNNIDVIGYALCLERIKPSEREA
jgi:hypothetical protein